MPRDARDAAIRIVRVLRDAGHVAYLAGGCVRDTLLGLQPKDYDVATSARPEQVRLLFRQSRYVGEAFGVVLVRIEGHAIEVATFRTEWGYQDGRRPSHVEFSDAQHDALRRDFTVNGLFEDPLAPTPEQRIIDFVGGRADLQARLIRAIGKPQERFGEDYLRMLRATRFAARLGFAIEPQTAAAIRAMASNLDKISRERIGQEVTWTLAGPRPGLGARLIQELQLDAPVFNEDHLEVPLPTLDRLAPGDSPAQPAGEAVAFPTLLAAWLLDRHFFPRGPSDRSMTHVAGTTDPAQWCAQAAARFVADDLPPIVARWRSALVLSNDHESALERTLSIWGESLGWAGLTVAKRKRLLAHPLWHQADLLLRAAAHHAAIAALIPAWQAEVQALAAEGVNPTPYLSGDDLIALGLNPGPHFRRLLDEVYDAQLEGRVTSRDQALEWVRRQA
jgi:poly(A) polymerase